MRGGRGGGGRKNERVSADAAWTQDMSDVRLVTPPCPLCGRSLVLFTESADSKITINLPPHSTKLLMK